MKVDAEKPAIEPEESEAAPMKAVINLNHMKHALKVVTPAVERTSTMPILHSVRMEQLPEGLTLEATNLDVFIRALVPESGGPERAIVIPAERFLNYAKLLDGDDVKLSCTDRRVTLQCGRARAVLPMMSAKHWPDNGVLRLGAEGGMAASGSATLQQGSLARALEFTMLAVCQEESRFTLNGVLLQGDGTTLKLVATDGHVLMLYTVPCEEKINLVMPYRILKAAVPWLADNDDGVDLWHDDRAVRIAIAAETPVSVAGPKITGTFPNWEAVFPKAKRPEITVNAKALLASLERCALLTDERSCCIRLTFDPDKEVIRITGSDSQAGEAEETVDCTGQVETALQMGVNGQYLISVVKKLDGDVFFVPPADAASPLLFKATPHEGETLGYVVMPMRI